MRRPFVALTAAALATSAAAQKPYVAIDDLQRLFIEDTVGLIAAPPSASAEAGRLMAEAGAARTRGDNGAMRRALSHARALIAGAPWDVASEYAASLAPRVGPTVIDPARPAVLSIGQHFAAPRCARCSLSAELRQVDGKPIRAIGPITLLGDDLIDRPAATTLDLSGITDGTYDVAISVRKGDSIVGTTTSRIYVARNLTCDMATIRQRAAHLDPASTTAATILYPLDLAEGLDRRSRQIVNADFRALLDRSLALLDAAESGRESFAGERGVLARAYRSPVTGRIEPYRIYIPRSWDGRSALPLVVMLHGSNGDETSTLADGKAAALAEARGWALLSPMGYSPNSGWGNHLPVVLANGTSPAPRPSTIEGVVPPRDGIDPEPAERDVLDTLAEIRRTYPIDTRRIYLMGNSMGGEGTWHLAQLHPQLWAAAAPGAGAIGRDAYPYARLRRLPILAVHGTKDPIISFDATRAMVDRLHRDGAPAELLAVDGAGHRAMSDVLPQVFDFFARHVRR